MIGALLTMCRDRIAPEGNADHYGRQVYAVER